MEATAVTAAAAATHTQKNCFDACEEVPLYSYHKPRGTDLEGLWEEGGWDEGKLHCHSLRRLFCLFLSVYVGINGNEPPARPIWVEGIRSGQSVSFPVLVVELLAPLQIGNEYHAQHYALPVPDSTSLRYKRNALDIHNKNVCLQKIVGHSKLRACSRAIIK